MLFSHPQIAELMSASFECAWESVRPVPQVRIDFGDGRTLERTLHGNIVTYFCTGEGEVFDLLPGLVDAPEYLRRLDQAIRLNRARTFMLPENGIASSGTSSAGPHQVLTDWHTALAYPANVELQGADPFPIFDGSKMRVERRIDEALTPPLAAGDVDSLRQDTLHNRRHRYPIASQILLEHPLPQPAEIANEVYRRALGVDLADPWLGLAPEVMGGEKGRG